MSPCQEEKVEGRPRKGGAGARERSDGGENGEMYQEDKKITRYFDIFPFQMDFCLI
jgi:hypothetical protein